jgi:hypothetical protein
MNQPQQTVNVTGTVDHQMKAPGLVDTLSFNKAAQVIVGAILIVVAIKAASAGWFSAFTFNAMDRPVPEAGFGSTYGLLPFVLDAVGLVGICFFALIKFIRGNVGPVFAGAGDWMAGTRASLSGSRSSSVTIPVETTKSIDPVKLNELLSGFESRLTRLEDHHPDMFPPSPEELEKQVAELQAKLAAKEKAPAKTTRSRSRSTSTTK